jgi:murein DD-endopeptidase MepM/ murein hydrolase activator NlpD
MVRAIALLGCAVLMALPATVRAPTDPAIAVAGSGGASEPGVGAGASGAAAAGRLAYRPPVDGPLTVARSFAPPATRYGAGHLGVDLRVRSGAEVHAAAAGRVSFAGQVAGRGVVVIEHADGISTEYEPLRVSVPTGAVVPAGARLGEVHGVHRGCAPADGCLHWGARRGGTYFDPLALLRPLGPVRLLPWTDGAAGR